jgi:hypothetical protein
MYANFLSSMRITGTREHLNTQLVEKLFIYFVISRYQLQDIVSKPKWILQIYDRRNKMLHRPLHDASY